MIEFDIIVNGRLMTVVPQNDSIFRVYEDKKFLLNLFPSIDADGRYCWINMNELSDKRFDSLIGDEIEVYTPSNTLEGFEISVEGDSLHVQPFIDKTFLITDKGVRLGILFSYVHGICTLWKSIDLITNQRAILIGKAIEKYYKESVI